MNTKNFAQYKIPEKKQNTSACPGLHLAQQSWELITTVSFRGGPKLIKMPSFGTGGAWSMDTMSLLLDYLQC